MALSILILCIVSMTPFNPVASSNSSQLSSDSAQVVDFGFSRLIDNLVSARNDSSNRKALDAVFAGISAKKFFGLIDTEDETLYRYVKSAKEIRSLYNDIKWLLQYGALSDHKERELRKLMKLCTSEQWDGLQASLRKFRSQDKRSGRNLMDSLIDYMNFEERYGSCWYKTQSPKHKIFTSYHQLAITTLQAYALRIYAYNSLRENLDQYSEDIEKERKEFGETIRYFQKSAISAIPSASREIRSCNYDVDEEGNKFIELKWLFNPIAINEVYLNEEASCWDTCPDYQNTTFYQYDEVPIANRCPGRLYNCFRETVNPCDSSANYHKRHFNNSDNSIKNSGAVKAEAWCGNKVEIPDISNGLFTRCDTCICYCGDHDRSDIVRRFSLRAVESDTSKNRVITGIQFVEKNQTIYLRIQEGELRPNGSIEKSTVEWQPINEIDWKSPFITEYDYVTITHDLKSVNLDTLVVSNDRVLTGIQLHVQGSHLALKIKSDAFSYSTGILQGGFWQSYSPMPRQEITMTAPDSPFFMDQSVVDTRKNTYVTFQKTDYEKDAAQTTVPVIDALPVVSDPPVPLSGVGIYYNGQTGYGGFIGLKAVTYDRPEGFGN